jgi:hydroxymethylpyrimidine/phosphomethylpyrimidine kinase
MGAKAVLVKGGHLGGAMSEDVLIEAGVHRIFSSPRIATRNTHGTGCTLSSAIAANLAKGLDLGGAIEAARTYLVGALVASSELTVGHGHGPLQHFHATGRG